MSKNPLFKIGYGLYILTSKYGEKDNGCIINTVMQIAEKPDTIAVSVNNANYTKEIIEKGGKFNVSVLTEETPFYVFEHFGFQSGRNVNKFEKTDNLFRSENGIYVVPKFANSYISGEVTDTINLGTHTLFIAKVTAGYVFNDLPTVTYNYYQENIKPKPPKTDKKGWVCKICGYIYEGEELPEDYVCPICKHGASDFEKLE